MAILAERKEYLENELKSYRYIVNQCYRYEQIIANSEIAAEGVQSPRGKEIIYENVGNPYGCNYVHLFQEIEVSKRSLSIWRPRREWIEERLSVLSTEEYQCIKYYYMLKQKQEWIADTLHISRSTTQRKIDGAIEKMLNL